MPLPLPPFVLAAAKLAVLLAAALTAANAVSFARYRRRHLRRIPNPIDDSADPVADFRALPRSAAADSSQGTCKTCLPPSSHKPYPIFSPVNCMRWRLPSFSRSRQLVKFAQS
jgi:hypothetical protein